MLSQLRAIKVLGWQPVLQAGKLKRLGDATIRGYYTTRAIAALFNIGLLEELAERQTINLEAFAAGKGLDLKVLRILCDYLYALRILDREGDTYALDPKGKTIVESLSGVFHMAYAYEDIFYHLEGLLQRSERYGVDITRRSESVAKGSGAVGKLLAFPMVRDVLRRRNSQRVLDLGCGDATFLVYLCEKDSRLHGVGIDISPEAIAAGMRTLAQRNLLPRVHLFTGDVLHVDAMANQLGEMDAATSIYVLHEFLTAGKETLLELLCRFKTTFPGVPLVVCEVIRHTPEELRQKPGGLIEIQLFHELSNQRLATREEWRDLFRRAGFVKVEEDYLDFVRTAIFTVS